MKKDLTFDLNIMPTLDILSVLICFLLLTAVWVQLGSIDVRQAVGDNSMNGSTNPPSLWATLDSSGRIEIELRDVKKKMRLEYQIPATRSGVNLEAFEAQIASLKAQLPDLRTGIVRPESRSKYGDVIKLMDGLKRHSIFDVGLSPLEG
jgi:biopolymer transport protein ExbD